MSATTTVTSPVPGSTPAGPPPVWTRAGARDLDRAAAAAAAALAEREQALTAEVQALAQLRVAQARQEMAADRAARRQARRAEARAVRAARRAARQEGMVAVCRRQRALAAVLPMMTLSAATAIPAQFASYQRLTGSDWSAGVIAAMVEGGTWLGAALESTALAKRRSPVPYRVLTWALAWVAAAVNVEHGLAPGDGRQGRWDVAAVFALASLLGPLCWAAYAHLHSGHDRPRPVPGARRRRMLHALRYPRLHWRTTSLRAATGEAYEVVWRHVWTDHHGKPLPTFTPHPAEQVPVEPARVEQVPVERVPVEPARVERVPVEQVIREQLIAALRSGELTVSSSVEAVRVHLGVAWRTARPWKEQLPVLAANLTPGLVEVEPVPLDRPVGRVLVGAGAGN